MTVQSDHELDRVDVEGRNASKARRQPIAFIDIETASQPAWLARQAVDAGVEPGPDTILWIREHAGDGALAPCTGQVVCWAVAVDDGEVVRSNCGHDEVKLLEGLRGALNELRPHQIVAHNGHTFDFPFLRYRALRLGMPKLAKGLWQEKPWGGRLVDTGDPSWFPRPNRPQKGWEFNLDHIAEMFGIGRPTTLPGADVPRAFYEQRWDEIEAHCRDDVRTLRLVYPRLAEGRS